MSILKLENMCYHYEDSKTNVLNNLNYEFECGKMYAIVGKSGAGKTTLLSLLSGLTSPTSGTILYDGRDIAGIDKYKYRSELVGVIFQGYNLLPQYTALENVMLSLDVSGKQFGDKKQVAVDTLEKVELYDEKLTRKILKLSGGEQQRVAIARALCYEPDIILADEPTGNLDVGTQNEVIDIFQKLAQEDGKCIIIVTHSPSVARRADLVYELAPLVTRRTKPAPAAPQTPQRREVPRPGSASEWQ